jgi:SNF family Na+-dependent transporter
VSTAHGPVTVTLPRALSARTSRIGVWVLTLSLLAYLPPILMNVFVIGPGLAWEGPPRPFTTMTPADMGRIRSGWVVFRVVVLIAALAGCAAMMPVLAALRRANTRLWAMLGLIAATAALVLGPVFLVFDLLSMSFETATLGEDSKAVVANAVGSAVFDLSLAATALLAWALRTAGVASRMHTAVAALAVACLIGALVAPSYFPPFVAGVLCTVVGVSTLRALRREHRGGTTSPSAVVSAAQP